MRNFCDNAAHDEEEETSESYPAIERVLKLLREKLSISTLVKPSLSIDEPLAINSEENYEDLNRKNLNSTSSVDNNEHSVRKIATEGSNNYQQLEIATESDCSQSTIEINFNPKSVIEEDINSIRDRAADILPAGRRKYFIAQQLAYRSLQSLHPS
jgi:hypothetical protein